MCWKWCPYTSIHSPHHLNVLKFTRRNSSWGTHNFLFIRFPETLFSYGDKFCTLCPHLINKSPMGCTDGTVHHTPTYMTCRGTSWIKCRFRELHTHYFRIKYVCANKTSKDSSNGSAMYTVWKERENQSSLGGSGWGKKTKGKTKNNIWKQNRRNRQ
jgi:hypothetical protein